MPDNWLTMIAAVGGSGHPAEGVRRTDRADRAVTRVAFEHCHRDRERNRQQRAAAETLMARATIRCCSESGRRAPPRTGREDRQGDDVHRPCADDVGQPAEERIETI